MLSEEGLQFCEHLAEQSPVFFGGLSVDGTSCLAVQLEESFHGPGIEERILLFFAPFRQRVLKP